MWQTQLRGKTKLGIDCLFRLRLLVWEKKGWKNGRTKVHKGKMERKAKGNG